MFLHAKKLYQSTINRLLLRLIAITVLKQFKRVSSSRFYSATWPWYVFIHIGPPCCSTVDHLLLPRNNERTHRSVYSENKIQNKNFIEGNLENSMLHLQATDNVILETKKWNDLFQKCPQSDGSKLFETMKMKPLQAKILFLSRGKMST